MIQPKNILPVRRNNGGAYKRGTALSVQGIMDEIGSELAIMEAWAKDSVYDLANNACIKAQALLGLLEVHISGSHGGYHPEQPPTARDSPLHRWQWLVAWFETTGEYYDPCG